MDTIFAARALTPAGWRRNIRLSVKNGHIASLVTHRKPAEGDILVDTLLPAPGNLHSHCFQRAMAGMTERRAEGRDTFWTWRELMYRFMDHITPEQYQAIAALVFVEMQEAGYASVGEFHYVHHQPGGQPYDDLAELSARVMAAAQDTGIGLTHLPVLYSYGGAGKRALNGGQLRFGNDVDRFAALFERTSALADAVLPDDTVVGLAPHSLRATSPADLARALNLGRGRPVHIHAAEQPLEVTEVQAWLGARPVEWLLAEAGVDARWCLIHATQMTETETADLAASGAVAGLCPITESNLGDGIFRGTEYLAAGGMFGIGSDSNIRITLNEELRTLEYSQRLRDLGRNLMLTGEGSVGRSLLERAAVGSARALARDAGRLEVGRLADMVALDTSGPVLFALSEDQLIDGWIFADGPGAVSDVWSAGRHQVRGGRHIDRDRIEARYRAAMTDLLAVL